jgi:hypothetical protein
MSNNDLIKELVSLSEEIRKTARYYDYNSTMYNYERMPCIEQRQTKTTALESVATKLEKIITKHVTHNTTFIDVDKSLLSRRMNSLIRWERNAL